MLLLFNIRPSRHALCLLVLAAVTAPVLRAQIYPFEDGNSQLTREGLVLTRFALGLTGAAMASGTYSPSPMRG